MNIHNKGTKRDCVNDRIGVDLVGPSILDEKPCGILQVNTYDNTGGAARIAFNLFKTLEKMGYRSYFAVGEKQSDESGVVQIPNDFTQGVSRIIIRLRDFLGIEEFDFPGTSQITHLIPSFSPDIIHCHNLHGGYFDLRMLTRFSKRVPFVITLHDAWLISGHCAHSLDCERWKTGCGQCPYLSIYPAIQRDATTYNWKRKQKIFRNSRLYIVTPCQWLMDKVNESILKMDILASKVIPNGVDLTIFHPANQNDVRKELGLPTDTKILLFVAHGIRKNPWKNYRTLQSTISEISNSGIKVLCLALGETAPSEHFGDCEIMFIPYLEDPGKVARYYQAADVYLHPSRAETFPNTILEALACGIPVVASAVGGIPEQIVEGKTGFLIPSGDAHSMAKRTIQLLEDDAYRQLMGRQAAEDAARRFGLEMMVKEYLQVYRELLILHTDPL